MDVEKERRAELMKALRNDFLCFEEVDLRHSLFIKHVIRADIVAIPLDDRFAGYALAFEVKEPKVKRRNYADLIQTLRQAADYVYAKIEPRTSIGSLEQFRGRRIAAAFLYPSPSVSEYLRDDRGRHIVLGALQLGLHFRVGHAQWETTGLGARFKLRFGLNEIWRSDVGFCHTGPTLLTGKRSVGSARVNVLTELDGFGTDLSFLVDEL